MEFGWSNEECGRYDKLVAAVRDAFPSGVVREGGPFTPEDWQRLGKMGLLGLSVPDRYGGGGLGALESARSVEAFGRACPYTGLVFAASAHLFACAMPITDWGGEELKRRFLPAMCDGELVAGNAMTEAQAGSDVSRLAVTATQVPGGWMLDGEKSFVSNGPNAGLYVTYATTDPDAGHWGKTAFVVPRDTPGVTAGEPFEKMGLLQCPAGSVRFENCFVPAENVIGVPGQGGPIFQDSMGWERACLFAGYVGLADRLLDQCVAHVRERRQFDRPLASFESVSDRVADMKLRLESARLLLYRACWEKDQGLSRSALSTALSKLAVSEGALANAVDAVRLFGGRGYLRADGIEAALRDSVPSVIFSGTSDIQRRIVARELGL